MNAVIVYESIYGSTRHAAEAVASALAPAFDVTVVPAAGITPEFLETADLLVIGAPTHAHGLPRPNTRRQPGAEPGAASSAGVRELLAVLPHGQGRPAAAFDTRLRWPRWLSGAASAPIAAALRRSGYWLVQPEASFIVAGGRGPLATGEVDRAAAWGRDLARNAAAATARPAA